MESTPSKIKSTQPKVDSGPVKVVEKKVTQSWWPPAVPLPAETGQDETSKEFLKQIKCVVLHLSEQL